MANISGVGLAAIAAGGIFIYGGIAGKSPLQAALFILRGQSPAEADQTAAIAITPDTIADSSGQPDSANPGTQGDQTVVTTPTNSSSPTVGSSKAKSQAIAKLLMPSYGWTTSEDWSNLVSLWDKESGWSNTADTRKTHAGGDASNASVFAYGIAQARPATKYPKPGQPPDLGGDADPTTQIRWGMDYIRDTYGDPIIAWGHEETNNWY